MRSMFLLRTALIFAPDKGLIGKVMRDIYKMETHAETLDAALSSAYGAAAKIRFEGMHYRTDIGRSAGRARSAGD